MCITKSAFTHISELDGTLAACVHEPIATLRVEFGSSDDFGQFFHIRRLDVDYVKALILNIEIPEVDSQVIAGDKCLSITVHRDTVDVIGVSISIGSARHSCYDSVMMCHSR